MATDPQMIGSAGTLVGAGLQTAGHYMQSVMLDLFEQGLGSSIGVLLYVISAIIAIGMITLGGHYKFGLWFLLGPAFYYQMIGVRSDSTGANWEFGARGHDAEIVRRSNEGVVTSTQPARVSYAFAVWDSLTSSIVKGLVTSLDLTDVNADLAFLSRTQRFGSLFQMKVNDGELQKFIELVSLNECSRYLALQLARNDKARVNHEDIEEELLKVQDQVKIAQGSDSYKMIQSLRDQKYFGNPPPAQQQYYTCRDVWKLALQALTQEASVLLSRVTDGRLADGLTPEAVRAELGKKFDPLGQRAPEEQVNVMIHAIAARMLLEHMQEVNPNLAQLSLTRHLRKPQHGDPQGVQVEGDKQDHFDVSEDLRYFGASYEYHGKGEYLSAMLALPYVQGMALYFLSLSFPFFALALVVPGRHHTFFLWMGLWFWVKSWDFGFAVVMLLDKLLFTLMPHGPEIDPSLLNNPDGPSLVFQELLKADPTYTINAYYNLLATCIAAVPVLTGVLVKKGGGEVLDAVGQGFNNFSGKIGGSMASYARSYMAQTLSGAAERDKAARFEDALLSSVMDKEVLGALGLKAWANHNVAAMGRQEREVFMKDFAKAMNNTTKSYATDLAMAKIEANMAMQDWKNQLSPMNMRRAELAVLMKYYNHDFIDDDPGGALQNLMVARLNYQMGGSMNSVMKSMISEGLKSPFILAGVTGHVAISSSASQRENVSESDFRQRPRDVKRQ